MKSGTLSVHGFVNDTERQPPSSVADWPTGDLESRVRFAIEEVRPALQADGGDVDLVRIEDGVVYVALQGACDGCPMAKSTLADFVTDRICLYAPEIDRVVPVSS